MNNDTIIKIYDDNFNETQITDIEGLEKYLQEQLQYDSFSVSNNEITNDIKLDYINLNEYTLPNLTIREHNCSSIGKYGLIMLNYLKTNKNATYQILLMKDELTDFLNYLDNEITNKVNDLIKELAEKENVNEELKDKDQMKWVGLMNNIKNRAEEIVLREYIEV